MEEKNFKICLLGINDESVELNMDMLMESTDLFEPTMVEETPDDNNTDTSSPQGLGLTDTDTDNTESPEKDIFADDSESVGKKDNNQASGKDTINPESPSSNTISSMLSALKQDGILPDIDDKEITQAKTAEDFASIIDKQVAARFDERQRRISEALDNGVAPDEVKQYENVISYLDGITEEALEIDDEATDKLRQDLIYQDFINKGFKAERAKKEVEKSIAAGTDIEDAKAARESVKEFFELQYKEVKDTKKQSIEAEQARIKTEKENFRKRALETEEPFAGVKLDKNIRNKVFENSTKPIEKDEKGNLLTPVQKYIKENPIDAQYYMSVLYTLTDGFKNIDKLVGSRVKGETKKSFANLERVLSSSSVALDSGNSLFGGSGSDDNSKITLDLN